MDGQQPQTDRALNDLVEALAAVEHERWSHWQQYMHGKCTPVGGALLIPAELVKRWEAQLKTPYAQLTEEEKESDREQVRRYLPLIIQSLAPDAVTGKPGEPRSD
jgi:hypothetical protein